ncbi:MAG: CBS domain-containing protein [Actinomycetota bacterium]
MTTDVITVRQDAPFKEVARLLDEHSVSALPVLDADGRLVGIVSEADLLPKEYRDRPGRLARLLHRHEVVKAEGGVAGDLMSSPAVTIGPDASLAEAAQLMMHERVKRLPVVSDGGELIGIVSRADLVEAFLRPDEAIAREIDQELASRVLLTEPGSTVDVAVDDGVVTLRGHLDRSTSVEIAEKLARAVDGVIGVKNELNFRWDDSKLAR